MPAKKKKPVDVKIVPLENVRLTPEQEHELIARAQADDTGARESIIRVYFPYVAGVAKKYHNYFPWVDFGELIEEGNFGLLQALRHYKSNKRTRFSSYAWFWIVKSIQEYITKLLVFLKMPSRIVKNLRKIVSIIENRVRQNKEVSLEDITKQMDLELDEIKDLLAQKSKITVPLSLDQYIDNEDQKQTLKDIIPDRELGSEEILERLEDTKDITSLLGRLTPQETEVIQWRFGFKDDKYHSLKEIAARLKITPQKVRDLESIALAKLKHFIGEKDS